MERQICKKCGRAKVAKQYGKQKGTFATLCDRCRRSPQSRKRQDYRNHVRKRPWVAHKGNKCSHCGFIAIHPIQLDVDHIDGNKANNDISNLQTLCANCHRLKTLYNWDFKKRNPPF